MRAWRCHEWCGPDGLALEEIPAPKPAAGQVRIAVHAAGCNFADNLLIGGKYQRKPELPFTPGSEVAGEVIEAGPGVTGFRPGDRVAATLLDGGYAEEALAPAGTVFPLPEGVDVATAAALPVTYSTDHHALVDRGRLAEGETLLVLGASGGIGLAAVDLGHALGARVIGAVGSPTKADLIRANGASEVILYREESIAERVRELTGGRGADVALDPVGGDAFDQAARSMAWAGRLLVVGFAAGRIPALPANIALLKSFDMVGVNWPAFVLRDPKGYQAQMARLFGMCAEGRLRPHVSQTFPLEALPQALQLFLDRRVTGKVVIEMT
ncbi:MAG: NADPH:quinone oxidoreductase family protein [bacterium]